VSVVTASVSAFFRSEKTISIITNLLASPVPTNISVVCHFLTVYQNFHALAVEAIWLAQVEHVESDWSNFIVGSSKEKPLSMSTGIHVVLKQQMIVTFINFHRSRQISRFEPTFKD